MRFILLLVLSLNIIYFALNIANPCVFPSFNTVLPSFFSQDSLSQYAVSVNSACIGDVASLSNSNQPQYSSGVSSSLSQAKTQQSGALSSTTPGYSFIDTTSLAFGFIGLVTGLNIISMFYVLQIPFFISIFLAPTLFVLYYIGLFQFIRNGFVAN